MFDILMENIIQNKPFSEAASLVQMAVHATRARNGTARFHSATRVCSSSGAAPAKQVRHRQASDFNPF